MYDLAHEIVDEVCLNNLPKDRILNPKKGSECILKKDGRDIPVKIIDGSFYRNGRVSNFWDWINLETGKKEYGYGNFFKMK